MNAIEQAARAGPGIVSFDGFTVFTEPVGQGAAGKVYQAHDLRLDRPVALKFLKDPEFLSADARARFVIEARVGGQLDHPNIVPVFRCSEDTGAPYLVMGWCGGGTLAEQMDGQPWEPRRAADLMRRIADAVAHAHARGVLHRDLKPGNILFDDQDEPRLADFGLAKLKDHSTALTQAEDVHGTPAYLAPEVATHGTGAASERSDVYALGAVLFELLAGQPPFTGAVASEVLAAVRRGPSPGIRERRPDLPPDLAVICDRCLARDPELRPESAERVACELGRFAEGRPVLLKPVPMAEQLASWVRRRPQIALGSFAALLLLGILATAAAVQWRRAAHLADRLGQTVTELSAANRTLETASLGHELNAALEQTGTSDAPKAMARLAHLLRRAPDHPAIAVRTRWLLNERSWIRPGGPLMELGSEVVWALFRPGTPEVVTADMLGRLIGWDRNRITQWPQSNTPVWSLDAASPVRVIHMAADGSATLSYHHDDVARLVLFGPAPHIALTVSNVAAIAVDPARRSWLIADKSGRLQWGDFPAIRPQGAMERAQIEPTPFPIAQVALSSTNGLIAVSSATNGAVALVDRHTGQSRPSEVLGKPAGELRFSPDGRLLLAWNDVDVVVLDPADGRILFQRNDPKWKLWCAVVSPDSGSVIVGSGSGAVTALEARTGKSRWTWEHPTGVNHLRFGQDPDTLFTICDDGTLRALDLTHGRPLTPANGHEFFGWTVDVSPDGNWLVSSCGSGQAGLWKFVRPPPLPRLKLDHHLAGTAWLGFPHGLALVTTNGELHCWNPLDPAPTKRFSVATNVLQVISAGKAEELILGHSDGSVVVQSVVSEAGARALPSPLSNPVRNLTLDPARRRVLAADRDKWCLLPLEPGGTSAQVEGALFGLYWAAFSPDGTRLAVSGGQYFVEVHDTLTGKTVGTRMQHGGPVLRFTFSPDGRRLATASQDFTARVWEVETGTPVTPPMRHAGFLYSVVFSADGLRLVTSGASAAHHWDATTGREIARYPHPQENSLQAEFSPDQQLLISAMGPGSFKIWSTALVVPLSEPVTLSTASMGVRFQQLPDSRGVVAWSENGQAVLKPLPRELTPGQMAEICEFLAGRRVGPTGEVEFIPPAEMRRLEERLTAIGAGSW